MKNCIMGIRNAKIIYTDGKLQKKVIDMIEIKSSQPKYNQ